ncbi:MAG: PDZ domain-containing protein, partial [Aeoliella sp.]
MSASVNPAVLFWFIIACAMTLNCARCEEGQVDSQESDAAADTPSEVQLAAWIAGLDHSRFAEREKATDALSAAGKVAVGHLTVAVRGESLEAADRAVGVLEQFAAGTDQPLQLAALEVLVEADRFPTARRRADALLAELNEQICRTRFEELGARFKVSGPRRTLLGIAITVEISIDPEEWTGTPEDFNQLKLLRRVDSLKMTAPMIDDSVVTQLAEIDGLRLLELVQTKTTVGVVTRLRKNRPELRILVRDRSMLGIHLGQGGGLLISSIVAGSPAEKAGLQAGDVVQKFNGHPVDHFDT